MLLSLSGRAFGQITNTHVLPSSDVTTEWIRNPSSGTWFSKVNQKLTYINDSAADENFITADETITGTQIFGISVPGSLTSGDIQVVVRAMQFTGQSSLTVKIYDPVAFGGVDVQSVTFYPASSWNNVYIDLGHMSYSQLARLQIKLTKGPCEFYPFCYLGVSTIVFEVLNAHFQAGIL
jgi:hypothetical protein